VPDVNPRSAVAQPAARESLTRARVLAAAVAITDEHGLAGLTMRSLADALGVKAMSLYHHLPNKEALLDAIVDAVFDEIGLPEVGGDWREQLRRRAVSARSALNRHPWALALMENRTSPGPATLRHHEAMLATLRGAGFSLGATAHAYALLDAFVYGFALQEATLPFDDADSAAEVAEAVMAGFASGEYPHLQEFATQHVLQPGYSFAASFDVGLDLVLDGIAALRDRSPA
jgi:AcrR family transcriptional regulator